MNERTVSSIGVYNPSTPSKSTPDRYINHAAALELVRKREAKFINRKAAIRLERPPQEPPSNWASDPNRRFDERGNSARVDEFVMGRYAEGRRCNTNRELVEAVDEWGAR